MATVYPKRGYLYLGWMEKTQPGKSKIKRAAQLYHPQTGEKLKDNPLDRKIADLLKLKKEVELKENPLVRKGKIKLDEAYTLYLSSIKSESMKKHVRLVYNNLQEFLGNIYLEEITNKDILELKSEFEQKYTDNTINTKFSVMRMMFNFLRDKGYRHNVEIPTHKGSSGLMRIIPTEHMEEIFNYLQSKPERFHHQYRYVKFLTLTGFRRKEPLMLPWKNIDFDSKLITVYNYKLQREDQFPLYNLLEEFLRSFYDKKEKYLFPYTSPDGLKFWKRMMIDLGYNYYIKDIRSTFGTQLVENGADIYIVQRLMRHKSVETTMKFYLQANYKLYGKKADEIFKKLVVNGSKLFPESPQNTSELSKENLLQLLNNAKLN